MRFILATSLAFLLSFAFPKGSRAQVVINEFVPDANPEWVEFYNASESAEFLKDYWLDDDTSFEVDSGSSSKKSLVSLDTTNPSYPFIEVSSFLNNGGDFVVLFSPEGGIVDQFQYTSNPGDNVSIGRSPDATGDFLILSSPTKGAPNAGPQPTPTPSPAPTPTPSPSQKPAATPKPTVSAATPTPRPKIAGKTTASPKISSGKKKQEEKATGEAVLGITQVSPSPKPEESPEAVQTPKPARLTLFIAATLVLVGLGFLSFALAPFVKEFLAGYNKLREETREV